MNIYEFASKYDISLAKTRKMLKEGRIVIDETEDSVVDEIRYSLAKGQPLSSPLPSESHGS